MVAMVNVGGKLVPENQTFSFYNGYGTTSTLNAAQAAETLRRYPGSSGGAYGDGAQWTLDEGDQTGAFITMGKPVAAPAPKAAAPAAAPAQKRAPARSILQAPPKPNLPGVMDPISQKEINEVTKPAKGLESTIKTTPSLLRERRKRSYLTAGA